MAKIISIIGAGGKTTLIKKLSEKYCLEGKKVLVTTTTHMMRENNTDVSCDMNCIAEKLQSEGYCMAGSVCKEDENKISPLPGDVLENVLPAADVMLVEADGAKHYSVKYPRDYEPMIYPESDEVIIVMGLWDIGRSVDEVVFGYEEMSEVVLANERTLIQNVTSPSVLTYQYIKDILIKAYLDKIVTFIYRPKITVLFSAKNNMDNKALTDSYEISFIDYEEAERIYGK